MAQMQQSGHRMMDLQQQQQQQHQQQQQQMQIQQVAWLITFRCFLSFLAHICNA
jgi:hypothetical protein